MSCLFRSLLSGGRRVPPLPPAANHVSPFFPPSPFRVPHVGNGAAIVRKLVEAATGQFVDSPASGAAESGGSAAVILPDVPVLPAAALTAAAGGEIRSPEPQKQMRQSQQEERHGGYEHTVDHPADCTVAGCVPDDRARRCAQDEPDWVDAFNVHLRFTCTSGEHRCLISNVPPCIPQVLFS